MNAQKALILDFGGVVTRTMFETHDITERALGLPAGSLTWRGPFDTATDPLWPPCSGAKSPNGTTGRNAPAKSAACLAKTGAT